jgi:hypothetical protein
LNHLTRIRRQDGKGTTIMLKTLQISTAATFVAMNEALAQTTPGGTRGNRWGHKLAVAHRYPGHHRRCGLVFSAGAVADNDDWHLYYLWDSGQPTQRVR